ncbi:Histidine kinase [Lutibacter oricola]|uniref:Histidine kinase n=1 Tax=Lutibacter oricola TaxID=762486 RepID=A0A1H3BM76_9FLAO|nr:histidine kinase [Lutibacter oricola]SDX43070.1 Histidine kinase [Lutibacter oricola]
MDINKLLKLKKLSFKKVSNFLIVVIAFSVSMLMNLPRGLKLFEISNTLESQNATISISDLILRVIFLFVISWGVLQLNANWRYQLKKSSLFFEIIITLIVHFVILYGSVKLFIFIFSALNEKSQTDEEIGFIYFGYVIVFIVLFFVAKILRYQVFREEDLLEKEILKQQSIENELTALKNQVNPHFLFNSLNSLSSLVRENKEATTFVTKLSFMYRYILQSSEKDLVTLKEEMKFLESYIHLIKTRYRDRIIINIDISEEYYKSKIPVLTLQLLVENCIKHNEISVDNPLEINIYIDRNYIVIENLINPKISHVESTGKGLSNINKRYLLLKEEHISISNLNNVFKVKLPIN